MIKKTAARAVREGPLHRDHRDQLDDDDELAWVDVSTGDDDVILATAMGKIARFGESDVRAMGRAAAGVIGIRLASKGDAGRVA